MPGIRNNLISPANESFETGVGTWFANTNCSVSAVATQAHEGTQSLQVSSTAAGVFHAGLVGIPVQGGRSYRYSYWTRAGQSGWTIRTDVDWYDVGGNYLTTTVTPDAALTVGAWTLVTTTLTSPATAAEARLFVGFATATAGGQLLHIDEMFFGAPDPVESIAPTMPGMGPSPGWFITPEAITAGIGAANPGAVTVLGSSAFASTNATTVVTGTISPTAGSLLVAECAMGNGTGGVVGSNGTVTDSAGGTWTRVAGDVADLGVSEIFIRDAGASPGSFTVTYDPGGAGASGLALKVLWLGGALAAASQPGATATKAGATGYTLAINIQAAGSFVAGSFGRATDAQVLTGPQAGTTLDGQIQGSAGDTGAAFRSTNVTSGAGSTTYGFTNAAGTGGNYMTLVEIKAAPTASGGIAKINTFSGGTDATTITTANSGTGSGDAFNVVTIGSGGAVAYQAANAYRDSMAARLVSGTAGAISNIQWLTGTSSTGRLYARCRVRMPVLPPDATGVRFATLTDSIFQYTVDMRVNNLGKVELRTGTGVLVATSTATYAAGDWIDVGYAILTFSSTVGQIEARIYDSTGAVAETLTSGATIDTIRSGGANGAWWGSLRSGINSFEVDVDDVAISNDAYPVIDVAAPPVTPSTDAPADQAALAFTSYDAAADVDPNADQAPLAWTGQDATAAAGVQTDQAAVTVTAYDATVSTTSSASVPAEQAATTYTGHDASASVAVPADPAAVGYTATDASVSAGARPDQAALAWTAPDAAAAVTVPGDQAATAYTAPDATASTGPQADAAPVGFTAYDATVSTLSATSAPAEQAATTYTAPDPTAALGVQAAAGTVAWTALDATVTTAVSPPAGAAAVAFTAPDPAVSAAVPGGSSALAFTAPDATAAVEVPADQAAVTWTAYDATVSTLSATSAPADVAAIAYTAPDPAVSAGVSTGAASVAWSAYDAGPSVGASPAQDVVTFTAPDATAAAGISAGMASAAWSAYDATITTSTAPTAEPAAVGFTAYDATVSTLAATSAPAEAAALAWTAHDPAVSVAPAAGPALVAWSAADAYVAATSQTGQGALAWTAQDATVQTGRVAGADAAALAFVASAASTALTATPTPGAVAFAALDATVVTLSDVRAYRDVETAGTMTVARSSTGATSAERGSTGAIVGERASAGSTSTVRGSSATVTGGQG